MRKSVLVLICGLLIGFVIGYFTASKLLPESIPDGYVRVKVNNKSEKTIKTLALQHENGSINVKSLTQKETVNLIFKNNSENSYKLIATFNDDSVVSSQGEYVESGYRTEENIYNDSIKITRDAY